MNHRIKLFIDFCIVYRTIKKGHLDCCTYSYCFPIISFYIDLQICRSFPDGSRMRGRLARVRHLVKIFRKSFFKMRRYLRLQNTNYMHSLANEARMCMLSWRGLIIIMTYRFFRISRGKYINFQLARRNEEKQHRSCLIM